MLPLYWLTRLLRKMPEKLERKLERKAKNGDSVKRRQMPSFMEHYVELDGSPKRKSDARAPNRNNQKLRKHERYNKIEYFDPYPFQKSFFG